MNNLKTIPQKTVNRKCKCKNPQIGTHTLHTPKGQVDFVYSRCGICYTIFQYERPPAAMASTIIEAEAAPAPIKKEPKTAKVAKEEKVLVTEPVAETPEKEEAPESIQDFEERQQVRRPLKGIAAIPAEELEELKQEAVKEKEQLSELEKAKAYIDSRDSEVELIQEQEGDFEVIHAQKRKFSPMDVQFNAIRFICKTNRTEKYFEALRRVKPEAQATIQDLDMNRLIGKRLKVKYTKVTPDGMPHEPEVLGFA